MYRFALLLQGLIAVLAGIIASKKGRNPFLWGVVCFFFPPMILVIGVLPPTVKPGKTKPCPYCNKVLQESDTECRYCGKEMPINLIECKACGSFVPEKEYCMNCNRKLKA